MSYGQRCSATNKNGQQCQAYAVRASSPALCSAHSRRNMGAGAPVGNQNAVKHGFYGRTFSAEELADLVAHAQNNSLVDEIALGRVALQRLMKYLRDHPELKPGEMVAVASAAFDGSRTVARLLRDTRALSGEAADGIAGAIAAALDELGSEWGINL